MITDLVKLKVGGDPVHEANETPEGINFVLHHKEKRGKEVWHALQVRKSGDAVLFICYLRESVWRENMLKISDLNIAQVKVVHHIGHKNLFEEGNIGVVLTLKEGVAPAIWLSKLIK